MTDSGVKVMIAVDGSEYADYAIEWYLSNLHKPENQVELAHVADNGISPSYVFKAGLAVTPDEWNKLFKEAEERVKALRQKHTETLKQAGVGNIKFRIGQGKPEKSLVDMIQDAGAEMVVIGTRGLGTVRRTILGSVSDYILHHTNVPVVVCRKPED